MVSHGRDVDQIWGSYTTSPVNKSLAPLTLEIFEMFAQGIEPFLSVQRDELTEELEQRIEAKILDAIDKLKQPVRTVYIQHGREVGSVTGQHEHFDLLMDLVSMRQDVYLWGEAGSGKTSAGQTVSKVLHLPFFYIGLQAQTTESKLMGYMDANGRYVESDFYKAYTSGGVFLLDELELANGNLLASLNGALANGKASFPCGIRDRHADFVAIATGNTPALGATVTYNDRRALDGSVRDRYAFLQWDTDKALEHQLAARHFEHSATWVNWIQNVRKMASKLSAKLIVTQRASIVGCKMLAAKMDVARVAEMVVWRGIDSNTVSEILSQYPLPTF